MQIQGILLSRGLLQKYDSVTAFGDLFLRHLQLKLNEHPCFGGGSVGSDEGGSPPQISAAQKYPLSDEAKVLLTAAVNSDGVVMRLRFLTGTDVTAGRNNFVEKQEPRSVATWEAAVDELADAGLIEDRAGNERSISRPEAGTRPLMRYFWNSWHWPSMKRASGVFLVLALSGLLVLACTVGAYLLLGHRGLLFSADSIEWANFGVYFGGVAGPLLSSLP